MAVRVIEAPPVRVWLVRHGRASAGWDVDPDPGLDGLGGAQAREVRDRFAPLPALDVLTSPLRRCRETSAPLCEAWDCMAVVEPRVAEIPSPEGVPMGERVDWLRAAMGGTWAELGPRYTAFRDDVVRAVAERANDTIVFSHFVAINAVIGAAIGDDRLVIRSLDNCSVTLMEVTAGPDGPTVCLVEGGHEADTLIR
jgi:broad specificity phosphatase PhoE